MAKGLSWKPVRKGARYCAPACGRGCTHEEWKAANRLAAETARKLGDHFGGQWHCRVWENLGWHASVYSPKGFYAVYMHTYPAGISYSVLAGYRPFSGAGEPGLSCDSSSSSPIMAMNKALRHATKKLLDDTAGFLDETGALKASKRVRP